jgi:hypothetical protein
MVVEKIPFEIEETNITEYCIYEKKNVQVKVSFYWDSHGKMIPMKGGPRNCKTFSRKCADVKIMERKSTMMKADWEIWTLTINNEKINGEVSGYNYNNENIRIKVIVGSG